MNDAVTYESKDGIAVISINRPDRLNAIGPEVEAGLAKAWERLRDTEEDRVGILTSVGNKAFSAGKDMKSSAPPDYRSFTPGVGVLIEKPLIAAISGWCIGGAIVLTQMCDLCVATEDAKFTYPEAKMGFAGGMIASLAARIPLKVAMELMLLGEVIDARRAYEVGMVNRLVPPGQHLEEAMKLARRLADNAPLVMTMLKRFAAATVPQSPVEVAGHAWRENERVFRSHDFQEGLDSFAQKRNPMFKGN
ncbi:enoyl-CoA hydratase [Allopusillimonas soli]|uniref:Enoyl-CoA hydratase/isomerase family protein n=1 Tax=Allopusillimonas soli TaxID=659016 RepID=A0A853FD35_9BURK|nr:enoyl-CoA hydratase-related protein [Allopusillimonas soli]NYT37819.1 enoyl-CoA hydratase/isomerase family protein [Allopusillimonas soli]TEA73727.1 enoyl-CoA hydratase [Allopusillimonas soli]